MSDFLSIGGSTLSGAAAGSKFGAPGAIIGGALGFFSGLFGAGAKNEADRLAQLQIEREKASAGLQGEARVLNLALNRMAVDRQRKAFSQQAMLSTESVRAGEAITGLIGSSIVKNARSSLLHQKASALQFSYQTERMGEMISQKLQDAADAASGMGEAAPPPKQTYTPADKKEQPTYTEGTDYTKVDTTKGNTTYVPVEKPQSATPDYTWK